MFQGSSSLKYYKRLHIYKNSSGTCRFDPVSKTGYSYNWQFVGVVNGVLLFNDYTYSNTTSGHQSAMRGVFHERGLKYLSGDFGRGSLDDLATKEGMAKLYKNVVKLQISAEMKRANTRAKSWAESLHKDALNTFNELLKAGFKLSERDQDKIRQEVYNRKLEEIEDHEFLKACKALEEKQALTQVTETELF